MSLPVKPYYVTEVSSAVLHGNGTPLLDRSEANFMELLQFFSVMKCVLFHPQGEYGFHIHLNIIDDLEKELTVRVKVSMQVRNGEGERDLLHRVKVP